MKEVPIVRQQIPALTLRSFKGKTVSAWDYKQKRNRVIVLVGRNSPGTRRFLRDVAAHASDWKEKDAIALIVFPEPPSEDLFGGLPPEVIAGVDAGGQSFTRYLGEDAFGPAGLERQGVFVADRYGEIFARWIVEEQDDFPGIPAILKVLEQIEITCEECQVASWPLEG
jgi:hypothetical protein